MWDSLNMKIETDIEEMDKSRWISEIMDEVKLVMNTNEHLRYGQTVFNVLYSKYSDIVNEYRGSDIDPFYNDGNVDKFMTTIYERIRE
jgi:hypothetical protein